MIEVRDVWFSYGGEPVLRGVTLTIKEGEFVAIMGENGAGKTTLIKHFNGLLKPSRGTVIVDGIDTRSATVARLSRIVGIAFQYPEKMFFCNTVWEEVEFGLRNFGWEGEKLRRRVEEVLEMMRLKGLEDRSPFSLSGGEQRRLAIACIVAWDPKYVVLDEPTAGQDWTQRTVLSEVIGRLTKAGKAVVIVTHDVEFVAELKPRVVLMANGKIIADGPAEKVLSDRDLLEEAGLRQPAVARFAERLRQLGIDAPRMTSIGDLRGFLLRLSQAAGDPQYYLKNY